MSLPPIGRRAFVADAAGGLLLCTLAGKQFAQFRDNHHGDRKTVVCVRVSNLDEQAMLLPGRVAVDRRIVMCRDGAG